ncbi:MAG TPA: hypothetical protein VN620_10945 [Candidatus Methylomirabilis sp.]|nr:hypothetical protein [Candidatus Methylomirabilis sp.]
MKRAVRLAVVVMCLSFVAATVATAQVPVKEGNVERVVLIHINAGRGDAFWADMKKNTLPIWEAQKAAGLIVDYQWFVNQTTSSPNDWNVGYTLTYKNMAALDGLADKAYDIRMKHYGDQAAEQKVVDKRVENAHVVSSYLLRDVTIR